MNNPRLSVIIPTYNRVKFLETTVNCFISQIKQDALENEVEIVIGDDTSPDSTREYLEKLEVSYPFIKTFINSKNLGLSGNVEKLVRTARAEFIWLFGDDDLPTPSSLKRILQSIKSDNPNVILLNTANIVSHDDRNLDYTILGENRLSISRDVYVESFQAEKTKLAAVKNWLYLTNLVSAVAFKKDLFLQELPEARKYLRPENVYVFQAPLIIGIARHGRLKIIAERSVLHRKNETHWSKTLHGNFVVSLYDGGEVIQVIKRYMPGEYHGYQKIFAVHTFAAVRRAKITGDNVNRYIIDALKRYYDCYPYNLRFLMALLIPGIIFRIYQKLWPSKTI